MKDDEVVKKKVPYSIYIDRELFFSLEAFAERHDKPKSLVVEAALTSFLDPDASNRRESAITKRLDRVVDLFARLERNDKFTLEAIALFVRCFLTSTALTEPSSPEARLRGARRYAFFLEALGQRIASGSSILDEMGLETGPVAERREGEPDAR